MGNGSLSPDRRANLTPPVPFRVKIEGSNIKSLHRIYRLRDNPVTKHFQSWDNFSCKTLSEETFSGIKQKDISGDETFLGL